VFRLSHRAIAGQYFQPVALAANNASRIDDFGENLHVPQNVMAKQVFPVLGSDGRDVGALRADLSRAMVTGLSRAMVTGFPLAQVGPFDCVALRRHVIDAQCGEILVGVGSVRRPRLISMEG
jgi:hypothetical protein